MYMKLKSNSHTTKLKLRKEENCLQVKILAKKKLPQEHK